MLAFVRARGGKIAPREIARAFSVQGADRMALNSLLRGLAEAPARASGRAATAAEARVREPDRRAPVATIEVIDIDAEEGDAIAHPIDWAGPGKPPLIRIRKARQGGIDLAVGERALVRLHREHGLEFIGQVLKRIERPPEQVLGLYVRGPEGGRIRPTDKKVRTEFALAAGNAADARPGDLVLAEVLPARRLGLPQARIVERLGSADSPKAASLIAIHSHDIPTAFPGDALAEAGRAHPAPIDGREDLRHVPLVTIDGEDARDFDDAVFAEPDGDGANPGGFHLIVAIADVGWYVRPGNPLDRAARERGNSVYFPDRVVPMLPERLSNDLCSLRPHEDRPCLAVHIWIDAEGRKRRHRFSRAMIRSAARLTYDEAQELRDGPPRETMADISARVIAPLYGAYHALARARLARGTLDLDLEERKVVLGPDGRVLRISPRPRFDSHRLIEEFMIAANVAAAESLEKLHAPCMYRVHDEPDLAKLDALRQVLDGLGFRLAKGQVLRADHFNRILEWAAATPHRHLVNQLVLRSQSLAVYSPDNRGHFGLALARYAHFTSPIRRYADLIVHRALIAGYRLGEGGMGPTAVANLVETADHISTTERRAAAAERDAIERYVAAYLADRIGARFPARISGVTRFGLFVTLDDIGADGLILMRSLPADLYQLDAERHLLRGRRHGRSFTLGQPVEVRLAEAVPLTGGMRFDLIDTPGPRRPRPGRNPKHRGPRKIRK